MVYLFVKNPGSLVIKNVISFSLLLLLSIWQFSYEGRLKKNALIWVKIKGECWRSVFLLTKIWVTGNEFQLYFSVLNSLNFSTLSYYHAYFRIRNEANKVYIHLFQIFLIQLDKLL